MALIMSTLASVISFNSAVVSRARQLHFSRTELNKILNIYGQMVSAGYWRDYAIEEGQGKIVFSVFKRASDVPAYRIVKEPLLARRQGAFSIVGQGGQIIRRGHNLESMLRHFRKKLFRLVD